MRPTLYIEGRFVENTSVMLRELGSCNSHFYFTQSLFQVGNGGGGSGVRWASVEADDADGGGGGGNSRLGGGGGGGVGGGGGGPKIPGGIIGGGGTPPDSFMIARAKSLNRRVLLNVGGTKHEGCGDSEHDDQITNDKFHN